MSEAESDKKYEQELTIARERGRFEMWSKRPVLFTIWDISTNMIQALFWLAFWFALANCSCDACIIKAVRP